MRLFPFFPYIMRTQTYWQNFGEKCTLYTERYDIQFLLLVLIIFIFFIETAPLRK